MRVYIASASSQRERCRMTARLLREQGTVVVSTWHDGPPFDRAAEHMLFDDEKERIARSCLLEVASADRVVAIGHPDMRGALVEVGYALGRGIRVEWSGDTSVTLFSAVESMRGAA